MEEDKQVKPQGPVEASIDNLVESAVAVENEIDLLGEKLKGVRDANFKDSFKDRAKPESSIPIVKQLEMLTNRILDISDSLRNLRESVAL